MTKEMLAEAIDKSFSKYIGTSDQNKLHDDGFVSKTLTDDNSKEWFAEASILDSDAWDYAWDQFNEKHDSFFS